MVMNKQKQVFGVVENVEENKDYTGIKTETAEITVDNINRVIKADVFFEGMLGETSETAYPGHLGAQTRDLVIENKDAIEQEILRATQAEESVREFVSDFDFSIRLGDSKVTEKVLEEVSRAKSAEQDLQENIDTLEEKIDTNHSTLLLSLEQTSASIRSEVTDVQEKLSKSDDNLSKRIDKLNKTTTAKDNELQESIQYVIDNYADKPYVYEQLIEFNKLHKRIADAINLSDNTVIIDSVVEEAQANVIYLVKEIVEDEEIYNQYTLIDNKLTFIGSSKIDLSDYATKGYVDNKISNIDFSPYATLDYVKQQIDDIPEVDLTDYAKIEDIPDVSEFINEIPSEYITESELEEKQYLTKETASSDFATKIYVQTELSKIGTLSKEIVDSVDLEQNRIVVKGELLVPEENMIYLVKQSSSDAYDQYTLIDNRLTFIGTTDIDLGGYATQEYVDEQIELTRTYFETTLNGIKFIDGGKAPL